MEQEEVGGIMEVRGTMSTKAVEEVWGHWEGLERWQAQQVA